jgi:hypothetical protein
MDEIEIMARGFEAMRELDDIFYHPDSPEYESRVAEWNKGSHLFIERFGSLWS